MSKVVKINLITVSFVKTNNKRFFDTQTTPFQNPVINRIKMVVLGQEKANLRSLAIHWRSDEPQNPVTFSWTAMPTLMT